MHANRYLNAVLTIIALELGWIALTHGVPVAQAQATATPVVITGIDLGRESAYLPVGVLGQVRTVPTEFARSFEPLDTNIRNDRVPVSVPTPIDVRPMGAIAIQNDRSRPLWVENVGYTPAPKPGE
jgi:hypothetical protein